jgi:ABC-type multidrug transport system ATPase subunit
LPALQFALSAEAVALLHDQQVLPEHHREVLGGDELHRLLVLERDLFHQHLLRLHRICRRCRFGSELSDAFLRDYAERVGRLSEQERLQMLAALDAHIDFARRLFHDFWLANFATDHQFGELMSVRFGNLPLGNQRLLEIARALAADPALLVLDEPAAGLRPPEKAELARLLEALRAEGLTILLVEHDMDFVMNLVDRIVVMDFGAKLAEGLPAEIRADARVQEAYLGGVA